MNLEAEMFLKNLGLSWITIAEAMSDENEDKTRQLLKQKPHITKDEFLKEMNLEEEEI